MPSAIINGIEVNYEVHGAGEPILWIGGTGGRGAIYKRYQVPHFQQRYQCLIYDLRSECPAQRPDAVKLFAEDAAALLDHLRIRSACVVGLSLGAGIAQELALVRPELVRSAILISAWSSSPREHHIRRWFEARMFALENAPFEACQAFDYWVWAPSLVDEEPERVAALEQSLRDAAAGQPNDIRARVLIEHYKVDLAHDAMDRLHQIRCPVLVLHGAEDLIALPSYNRRVAELIPGAQRHEVPRSGHLPILDQPEATNEAIDAFLRQLAC